jgi:hypothetical protein
MNKKNNDRHLQAPSEANRDKHINFEASENNEQDPADAAPTGQLREGARNKTDRETDKRKRNFGKK